jgi:hypothetical protein
MLGLREFNSAIDEVVFREQTATVLKMVIGSLRECVEKLSEINVVISGLSGNRTEGRQSP